MCHQHAPCSASRHKSDVADRHRRPASIQLAERRRGDGNLVVRIGRQRNRGERADDHEEIQSTNANLGQRPCLGFVEAAALAAAALEHSDRTRIRAPQSLRARREWRLNGRIARRFPHVQLKVAG